MRTKCFPKRFFSFRFEKWSWGRAEITFDYRISRCDSAITRKTPREALESLWVQIKNYSWPILGSILLRKQFNFDLLNFRILYDCINLLHIFRKIRPSFVVSRCDFQITRTHFGELFGVIAKIPRFDRLKPEGFADASVIFIMNIF